MDLLAHWRDCGGELQLHEDRYERGDGVWFVCEDCGCELVDASRLRGAVEDAETLARAVSASLTHGERSPLADALTAYLERHPWSDL